MDSQTEKSARYPDHQLRRWLTPRLMKGLPIHNWFVYPHSFTRDLVHHILEEIDLRAGSLVGDPFVGAGSTVLSCKEKGISAVGYDLLPLSVLVTNVKVRDYNPKSLRNVWHDLVSSSWSHEANFALPRVSFFDRAFDAGVLRRIVQIKKAIYRTRNRKYRQFFLLGLVSIVGQVSKTAKGGGWLRLKPENCFQPSDVDTLFINRVETMIRDLETKPIRSPHSGKWLAVVGDARSLPKGEEFGAVITSPPYLNRHDYTRIFLVELGISYAPNDKIIKDLRYKTIRSHVEARRPITTPTGYTLPAKHDIVLAQLHAARLNNSRLPDMVSGYFEDLYLVLHALFERVRKGGRVVFVLGNVRFGGVMIPVDEIVAEIGEQVGFRWDRTIVGRYRGNSAQQMGTFSRQPSAECLIYWTKR